MRLFGRRISENKSKDIPDENKAPKIMVCLLSFTSQSSCALCKRLQTTVMHYLWFQLLIYTGVKIIN